MIGFPPLNPLNKKIKIKKGLAGATDGAAGKM